MRKAFNAKAAQAAGVKIIEQHFDPHLDALFVLGRAAGGGYFTAWQSRHRDDLVHGVSFPDRASARAHFEDAVIAGERSNHRYFRRDWQKLAVYAWEQEHIGPRSKMIDMAAAKALVKEVCADYDVPLPRLRWEADGQPDYYDPDSRELFFGSHNDGCLLHELAHHIHTIRHEELDDDNEDMPPHSPAFVYYAIALYDRYAGIDMNGLIESAAARNILGPPEAAGHIQNIRKTGTANDNHGARKGPGRGNAPQIAP